MIHCKLHNLDIGEGHILQVSLAEFKANDNNEDSPPISDPLGFFRQLLSRLDLFDEKYPTVVIRFAFTSEQAEENNNGFFDDLEVRISIVSEIDCR